jgi:uncharacterized membrane protein
VATLILGLCLFLASHSISIVAPAFRDRMAGRLGEWGWKGVYSLLSIASFMLLLRGYGEARLHPIVLYQPPHLMRHITALLMVPVFPLLLAAYFPGRIKSAAKHPFLVAVKLWACAHLLSNGTLHDLLLFAAFLAWAVADRVSLKRRAQRPGLGVPPSKANDFVVVGLGLGAYLLFLTWAHLRLIGVAPLG